ncbi:hypothetical protein [Dyadobacter sp. OTU695]|uniref:hypothetical protein n=1 Tax=Dyadobacter sp. OTU695 TaxID=3043860 RepID=UPI00313F0860
MFKISYALSILSLLFFSLASCQNDQNLSPKTVEMKSQEEVTKMVNDSKKWFEKQPWSEVASNNMRMSLPGKTFFGVPKWDGASFFKLSETIPVFIRYQLNDFVVDVSYTKKMNPKGFRDMLMRKMDDGSYVVDIIEIHPDTSYLEKKSLEKKISKDDLRALVDDNDFTGYFLVYSRENGLRYGERRENGLPVARLQP